MNIERLCEIATKATQHTLRYHTGVEIIFEESVPARIRQEIHELYSLRDTAQDSRVADLEIACDAAVTVAEDFNRSAPQAPGINLRWFYICVQGLLLVEIKPELLLGDKIARLPRKTQQQQPSDSDPQSKSSSPAGSSTLSPGSSALSPEPSPPSGKGTERVSTNTVKAKWEDDEIQLMVELKASGMRHCDVATRLGRGQGSVENKYGRIMQKDKWKKYSNEFEANLQEKGTQ